ncbi:protein kinase [Candidatus Sumerlaeota bacterium]|nr:protein kinase [Candidatus Sumerlaeota bacterium]
MAQNPTVELFLPFDRLKIQAVQNTLPDGRAISWQAVETATGTTMLVRNVESPIHPGYNAWLRRADWAQWGRVTELKDAPGRSWIVREWVEGASLATLIGDGTTVIPELAVRIMFSRLCRVISRLHREGEAHGRLKPTNVIAQGTRLFVVDPESNTTARNGSPADLTQEFHVTGDLHYLAPEQLAGLPLMPSSDVYAIGCMLYETMAGRPPFGHINPVMLCSLHFSGEYDPIWKFRTDITDVLEMLVRKCLAKDPALRFQTAGELEHALLQGVEGHESEIAISSKYEDSMNLLSRLRKARETEGTPPVAGAVEPQSHSLEETDSALLDRLKQQQAEAALASEAILAQASAIDEALKHNPSRTAHLSRAEIQHAMEAARMSSHETPLEPLHVLRPERDMFQLQDWELIRPPWNYEEMEPMEALQGVFPPQEEQHFLTQASEPFLAQDEARRAQWWRAAFFLILIYAIAVTIVLVKVLGKSNTTP